MLCPPNCSPTAISIRKARDDEYDTIADMHYAATATDPLDQLLIGQVDPDAYKKWVWIDGAKGGVQRGSDTVVVAECTVTGGIVGVAWYKKFSASTPPPTPGNFPEGFNVSENAKISGPRGRWFKEMLDKYKEYFCR